MKRPTSGQATKLYAACADSCRNNTLQCKVTGGVTYIPIPNGSGENFAGLLTVDLPPTVVKGQEFNVEVRRVGRKRDARRIRTEAANGNATKDEHAARQKSGGM